MKYGIWQKVRVRRMKIEYHSMWGKGRESENKRGKEEKYGRGQ